MAKIVEMKILDLRDVECRGKSSTDVAPIERAVGSVVKQANIWSQTRNHQPRFKLGRTGPIRLSSGAEETG